MNAIGVALGPVESKIADKARLRVLINGLIPLTMKMDIELPSKAVVEVELEYEGLQKHCFLCKALSHEDEDCPNRNSSRHPMETRRDLGISQLNTLEKIEESKRRQEDRRVARSRVPHHTGARWTNYRNSDTEGYRNSSKDISSKRNSERSSAFEENRRRFDDRTLPHHNSPSLSRRTSPRRDSQDHGSSAYGAPERSRRASNDRRISDDLRAADDRAIRVSSSKEANSRLYPSPQWSPKEGQRKTGISSRLSDPRTDNAGSEGRASAKDRLSVQTQRTSKSGHSGATSNSKRLQEVEVRYLEDTPVAPQTLITTRPSSSNVFDSGRLGICERSPIRTLSEDRIHVSLRLGPLGSDSESGDPDGDSQSSDLPVLSKAEGKRVVDLPQAKRRATSSQGTTGKRRRVTKTHESPRRKLLMDAIGAGTRGGLSLSWKDEVQVEILFSSANIIDTRIEAQGTFCY
ncbi:unnamed protein product, partial [Brassica rapa subsp. trilocularis]